MTKQSASPSRLGRGSTPHQARLEHVQHHSAYDIRYVTPVRTQHCALWPALILAVPNVQHLDPKYNDSPGVGAHDTVGSYMATQVKRTPAYSFANKPYVSSNEDEA